MTFTRLPRNVVPTRYDIHIEPDMTASAFLGRETVEVTVLDATREIVLNAVDLQLRAVVIRNEAGRRLDGMVKEDDTAERASLHFSEPLHPGVWRLSMEFTGTLNDKLRGFYRSTFTAADGTTERLAVTQFEATDARRAFPCWDEPAFKAVFQLTLVVDEGLEAISNAVVVSVRPTGAGKKTFAFAPTIRMSTYLVAFVIGKLEATEAVHVNGIPIRVWSVPGKRHLASFALEVAAFSLRFFAEYYGIPYPVEKLDLIAIPDFAFGAMENLGAITFRETALLVVERAATHAELTRVAHVVAHEIAHMWFGDLVTMAWWNGLWLNEAFATFMEILAVDAWKPAWGLWGSFGASRAAAFLVDGLRSSRPIEFEVVAPKDAEAMFDVLTYEKGGAVLRMLQQYLGAEVFRDGVRRYLAAHQFSNAETTDLWKSLGEAAGQPIPAVMDGWIFRQGYPLVSVEHDAKGGGLRFTQRAFRYLEEDEGDDECWQVPVTYRARIDGEVRHGRLLLSKAEGCVPMSGRLDEVVVNEGGHGFYRVRYALPLQQQLLRAPSELMTPIERFNLINDAWAASLAGIAPVSEFLDLTARFKGEIDRHVWIPLLGSFGYLSRILPPDVRPSLGSLVRDRLREISTRLGWVPGPNESDLVRQLRSDILRTMGTLGEDGNIQEEARALYAGHEGTIPTADPGVLTAAIAILAHAGAEREYETFQMRFKEAKTPQEEQRYLHALAGFRPPELVHRTLALAVSGQVRTQDAPFLVRDLLMGVHSRELAWVFLKEHWEQMERLYPSQSGLRRMCEGITALATPALEADVREFFSSRAVTFGGKTLEQYLEQLRIAVAFRAREADTLARYFGALQAGQL